MRRAWSVWLGLVACLLPVWGLAADYAIVDTGQQACFNDRLQRRCEAAGSYAGQDAQYQGNQPAYRDNGDGTISDLVTGLMWVKARGKMMRWSDAMAGAAKCRAGGHDDWRAPTIKELYSLINFTGWVQRTEADSTPFIDTAYFEFRYGDQRSGARLIDCQDWSATEYQGTTMGGNPTVFGVNFADGRIKGYPKRGPRGETKLYIRYVRGNPRYGRNDFRAGDDGTVKDRATSLVWQRADNGETYNWRAALGYCEGLTLAGRSDWRLPNAKELQSLVDYSRGPSSTGVPAIDPIFSTTDPESYFWSSTTHLDGPSNQGMMCAAYVAFGRALGFRSTTPNSAKRWMDVHGAGAQRSDLKTGTPSLYSKGHGPQGDDVRIYNYARCVRGGVAEPHDPHYMHISTDAGSDSSRPGAGQDHSPHGGRQGNGMGPPPKALEACSGKDADAACSFSAPHGTVFGTCQTPHGQMFCVPKDAPSRGGMQ